MKTELIIANQKHSRELWIDLVKAFAICWIWLNHFSEMLFGWPFFANPSANWPGLHTRFVQLKPLTDWGALNIPLNFVRYLGWMGDAGVQLFLISSGLVLTMSALRHRRGATIDAKSFYRRRLLRIYPPWWLMHGMMLFLSFFTALGVSAKDWKFWLSLLGIRFTPALLSYISPAWWYIGLAIQLYLVFPFLLSLLNRVGAVRFFLYTATFAFAVRLVGLLVLSEYLEAWARGAIFLTRLPEFALGMVIATFLVRDPGATVARVRRPSGILVAAGSVLAGFGLSFFLVGMTVAPFLLGAGVFFLLFAVLYTRRGQRFWIRGLRWLGEHSYGLFLVHYPILMVLMPRFLRARNLSARGLLLLSIVVLTVTATALLDWISNLLIRIVRRWWRSKGPVTAALRVAAMLAGAAAALISAELIVRQFDPQEVYGWGEKPALQRDARLGYRLVDNKTIRLRWLGYDYVVRSNRLGFPGPDYTEEKDAGTLRIMTIGDAFTSAEGVDTDQSWPRLLEKRFGECNEYSSVEVLNFAVTGYGPQQYRAVVEQYAARFAPDVIVIGFFVNEYFDILVPSEEQADTVGFDLPPPRGIGSLHKLPHLKSFVRVRMLDPLKDRLLHEPEELGYFLGNFSAFETSNLPGMMQAAAAVKMELKRIHEIGSVLGAPVILLMIPASIQVQRPQQLAYFPNSLSLVDGQRFDLDQPQRITRKICSDLGIFCLDLRETFSQHSALQLYHRRNMHWSVTGHRIAADTVFPYLRALAAVQGATPR